MHFPGAELAEALGVQIFCVTKQCGQALEAYAQPGDLCSTSLVLGILAAAVGAVSRRFRSGNLMRAACAVAEALGFLAVAALLLRAGFVFRDPRRDFDSALVRAQATAGPCGALVWRLPGVPGNTEQRPL